MIEQQHDPPEGLPMKTPPDSALTDAQALIADLRRQLAERTAERDEALEQQTATAEVLGVINAHPGDLTPIFRAMLERATRLCAAETGHLFRFENGAFFRLASHGVAEDFDKFFPPDAPVPLFAGSGPARMIETRSVVHVHDVREDEGYRLGCPDEVHAVEAGILTVLFVPLIKDGAVIGHFTMHRMEVKPFTDQQIALVENFAAQAVIAMENARLLTETQEALDQQTATAEVLGVINASPGDLNPVFDAMLEKATRLCDAAFGVLWTHDGEKFDAAAMLGVPPAFADYLVSTPVLVPPEDTQALIRPDGSIVHIPDAMDTELYRSGAPLRRALVDLGGARTALAVPLRRDSGLLGMFMIYRKEVRPFADKQIALVQNFAAQAVIAIENARLITETQEALDQQTATAEVLSVINAHPGDLTPVFDAILERAHTLCGVEFGSLQLLEGDITRAVAWRGLPESFVALIRAGYPVSGNPALQPLLDGAAFSQIDLALVDQATSQRAVELAGMRTFLAIPLRKEGVLLGHIASSRREVSPFTDKQIALLQNFAAQAVIAIENARLINETREALEQQTATAEVLQVINSSPGDLQPVFDAMLERAVRLSDAAHGYLYLYEGGRFAPMAMYGDTAYADWLRQRGPVVGMATTPHGRIQRGERFVHIADVLEDEAYLNKIGGFWASCNRAGTRTFLAVSLRKDDALLGTIHVYRREVQPFSERQIALLQNFAAQAVIAMENARLITETREALDQQTATAEVLGVINSSPGDLAPVFDAMLEKAMRLCEASYGELRTYDGQAFHIGAMRGVPEPYARFMAQNSSDFGPETGPGRVLKGDSLFHVIDLYDTDNYRDGEPNRRALVDIGGARTLLLVPLRRDEALLGYIMIYRTEVRPFTDKQIALLQNFAAQAVIAMENARLITETREALEQQTATAEVLRVINSSIGDPVPVFDAILEKAFSTCGAAYGTLAVFDGELFRVVANRGLPASFERLLRQPFSRPAGAPEWRLVRGERLIHVPDIAAPGGAFEPGDPLVREAIEVVGIRTLLFVPLRKDGALLGYITVHRTEVRPFTDKQIALLENFAAQAVIAMENARLITETQEALDQQTATAEVLQVINSSPGDLAPVFDAMLEKAMRLCDAAFGTLTTFDANQLRLAAARGVPTAFAEFIKSYRPDPGTGTIAGQILAGAPLVHNIDLMAEEAYRTGDPIRRATVDLAGARSSLAVPLRKDESILGFIHIYRRHVQAFSDKQIALLQNFAAQAVIAIENARLITETREALEQQTATAEVLGVINAHPGDLTPVFEAILDKAHRFCGAERGTLFLFDGERFRAAATHGYPGALSQQLREGIRPGRDTHAFAPLLEGARLIHNPDLRELDDPLARAVSGPGGVRTNLLLPLRREGVLLGMISCNRTEVRPFSDKEIALLENFAAQAVIAMENARLITETREALDQQTATAEVLGVINSSPGDLTPVFEAMLDKAMRLCEAAFGTFATWDGEFFHPYSHRGVPEAYKAALSEPVPALSGGILERIVNGEDIVQVADLAQTQAFRLGIPAAVAMVERGGTRSAVWVALRKDDVLLGAIVMFRREVRPFTEKQIALLRNFAAQAVIAMENARLLDEIRQRQAELRVTFDNMADGVVMFDHELRLAAWNKNFQELLDLPDELLEQRKTYAEYLHILADRGEFGPGDVEEELSRRLAHADEELRFERTRPDGRILEVRRNAVAGGGFVLIYSDITERKRSEEEIRAARDAAEAALSDLKAAQGRLIQAEKMASLGQLTAGIAHEIKNPLNFVNNFASLSVELLDELKEVAEPALAALDEDKRDDLDETIGLLTGNLEKIAEHGKRADNIVKSMLEHSRGVSGERREVDLNALVEEALNLAYHGARAQDQSFNITLEREFDRAVQPIELVPQDITRVLLNLFGNGFYAANKRAKADGNGQPVLNVATRDAGDAVEIRVRDNGTGIPPDIRDKLFQPFFTTKPTGEGTGLGLSISYDVVTQQHGGTITVDSEEGSFTEFTIRLPRQQTAASGAEE